MNTSDDTLRVALRLPRSAFTLDVDLHLPGRGITALFGPSGSGKTTLLRCVAGLERALQGEVRLGHRCWQDSARGQFTPTWQRDIGFVFQEASLFDHLDVSGNLRFGLPRRPSAAQQQALEQAVTLLGIGHLLKHRPDQLSGGERQRVAMARALVTQPRMLLLDEPMASLDASRKQEIFPWLERLRDELSLPVLYVSHASDEVARLASTVVSLDGGRAQSVLAVEDFFARTGQVPEPAALLQGRLVARDAPFHLARVALGPLELWIRDPGRPLGDLLRVRVPARDVSLTRAEPTDTSIQNHWPGTVAGITPADHPAQVWVQVRCGPHTLIALVTQRAVHDLALREGEPVWAQVKSVAVVA